MQTAFMAKIYSKAFVLAIECPNLFFYATGCSPVGEGWKTLTVTIVFQVFSTIQGKTVARNFCNFSSEALQSL